MLTDLCLAKGQSLETLSEYRSLLKCCIEQGYSTVATNKNYCDIILTGKETCTFQPVDTSSLDTQHLTSSISQPLCQLSRVTMEISEPRFLQQFNDTNKFMASYDLIAIKPKNDRIFHSICMEYDYYDIITFDMGEKIPFMLKRSPVYEAIQKGKYFELCYGALFDGSKKRICLTNSINIIKATKGKNLIVTSDAASHIFHRGAVDICSLLTTLGLSRDQALNCIRQAPDKCVRSARNRKLYKGVIEVVNKEEAHKLAQQATRIKAEKSEATNISVRKCKTKQAFKTKHMKKVQKMKDKLREKELKILHSINPT